MPFLALQENKHVSLIQTLLQIDAGLKKKKNNVQFGIVSLDIWTFGAGWLSCAQDNV